VVTTVASDINYVTSAHSALRSIEGTQPTEVSIAGATTAQALATLALVEQQRIANLIAYKQLHTAREMSQTERGWHLDDLDVGRDNLTDEIEAALGLNQGVTKP
jgi:hypothetical protein